MLCDIKSLGCEQAHLFGVSHWYLGGRAVICEPAELVRRM